MLHQERSCSQWPGILLGYTPCLCGTSFHQVGLQEVIKHPLDGLLPPAVSSEILNPVNIEHQRLYHATSAGISLNDVMLPSPVPCRTNIMAPYSTTGNYACTVLPMTQSSYMTPQQVPVSSQTHHTVDPGMYYQQKMKHLGHETQ